MYMDIYIYIFIYLFIYIYRERDMHLHTCMHTYMQAYTSLHSTPLAHLSLSLSRSICMYGEDGSDVDIQAIIMRAKTTPWGGVLVVQGS